MSCTSDPGKWTTFFIAFLTCLGACVGDGAAQSRFKTEDDSLSKAVRANEQHKLAGIERLVEATRSYDNLDLDKAFTILAPNNLAFRKLPVQMIDYLIDPAHESDLNELLACHTLIGKFSEKQIRNQIEKAGGKAAFTTLAGFILTATTDKDNGIIFIDKFKRKIKLLEANYRKGDFPVHIIDGVILPYNAVY
jgi:uncharacterized surface protein with fasciclin (FAS1) repeats